MRDGRVLGVSQAADRAAHSLRLLGCVDEALAAAGVRLRDVELFAASIGPGSFTGLRTGLATVKAFAEARGKRVVPVPTLHAVAAAEGEPGRTVIAITPAGRNEVFAQRFRIDAAAEPVPLDLPRHVAPDDLLREPDTERISAALWVGAAARRHEAAILRRADELGRNAGSDLSWDIAAAPDIPYAVAVALLAASPVLRDAAVPATDLRALYVRLSDAEIKERAGA